jgi:hypothetical protein
VVFPHARGAEPRRWEDVVLGVGGNMQRLSFPEARTALIATGFRYLGTACIADCDTSYWAHPTTLMLAAIVEVQGLDCC